MPKVREKVNSRAGGKKPGVLKPVPFQPKVSNACSAKACPWAGRQSGNHPKLGENLPSQRCLELLWVGSLLVSSFHRRWTEPLQLLWFNLWLLLSAPHQFLFPTQLQEERKEQRCHILVQIELLLSELTLKYIELKCRNVPGIGNQYISVHSCCTQAFKIPSVPTCYCALQTQLLNLLPPWTDGPCVWWHKSPFCASTFSSTGTPPTKPQCWFPAKGGRWAHRHQGTTAVLGRAQEWDTRRKGFGLPCLCVVLCFPDSPAASPLHAVLSTRFRFLLLLPTCSQDTFCAPPPPTHIIWIHIIKRLAAEIAQRKIILNWFINAHLRRILKYDKNMRATEKGSEWE